MSFNDFIENAWKDHGTEPQQVANRILAGMDLIEKQEQIPTMAQLITHVYGEHLGQWSKGIEVLEHLKNKFSIESGSEEKNSLIRSMTSLELASGLRTDADNLSPSDQIRSMAFAASALCGQGKTAEAQNLFKKLLEKAKLGIAKEDPANRAIAVTGNNLAASLEEKSHRTQPEVDLMILAAQTARKYWAIAGGWLQIERAEYRLAKTYLCAQYLDQSFEHAHKCLAISQENNAPALEYFFGYEALAMVVKAKSDSVGLSKARDKAQHFFNLLSESDKKWCQEFLQKINT